jgi:hypothetical protein
MLKQNSSHAPLSMGELKLQLLTRSASRRRSSELLAWRGAIAANGCKSTDAAGPTRRESHSPLND